MDILTLIGIAAAIVGIIAGVVQVVEYLQKRREKGIDVVPEPTTPQREHLTQLRQILTNRFDEGEVQTLCFDLGIDYDILSGDDKADKVRELIEYLERRGRVSDLVAIGKRLRPDVAWDATLETLPQQQISHNLPPRTEFIGRESEKSNIHRALRSRSRLVSIDGIGGIGKTALALEVAHECLHVGQSGETADGKATFDGFIWITAKDRDLNLENVLGVIARVLDYPAIAQKPTEEKLSATRKLLRSRQYLLIVDNLDTITDESVFDFLNKLPEPSKALITTRKRSALDATMFFLEDLNEAEALALMRNEGKRLGLTSVERAESQLLLRLYQSTGGAPLAIKWAVGQIRQKGQSLETVLRALRKAKASIFDTIFSHSWDLLSADAQQVIQVMPLFATSASWEGIEAVSGVQGSDLDEALGQLVEMSLMDVTDGLERARRRYSVHPLTRAFVAPMYESDQASHLVQDTFERMLDYYRQLVTPPKEVQVDDPYWDGRFNYAKASKLEQEADNLTGLIRQLIDKGRDADALDLFLSIVHFLDSWELWDERLELSRKMCQAAHRLKDPAEAWLWIDSIGFILRQRQQLSECIDALERGRSLARQFDLSDALILADIHEANLYAGTGKFDLAQEKLDHALEQVDLDSVLEHATAAHRLVATSVLSALGLLNILKQDFISGKEWYEKYLKMRRSLGDSTEIALLRLAYASLKLDDVPSAEKYLAEAIAGARKKDWPWIRYEQAMIAQKRGELYKARRLCDLALEQFSRLGEQLGVQGCQELLAELPALADPLEQGRKEQSYEK